MGISSYGEICVVGYHAVILVLDGGILSVFYRFVLF